MPSPEEFGGSADGVHGVGAAPRTAYGAPDMEALKARAREIREAQARKVPIPGTGVGMLQPAAVPVQAPVQWHQSAPQPTQSYVQAPPSIDEELEQVRAKFKLASYYEALIEQPAFGDDVHSDPYAAQVQHELTEWVKGRMMELTGVRNNPEGFLDEEVQLLKAFAQGMGLNGIRALQALADRVLNPPASPPPPPVDLTPPRVAAPVYAPAPTAPPDETDEDQGSSAMSFAAAAPVAPPPPQVAPVKSRRPYVRRARVPGAPAASQATVPGGNEASPAAESEPVSQRRGRKRAADPLAAGRAAVASSGQPEAPNAPAGQPGASVAAVAQPPNAVQPVPMPKGLGMSMAMEQKAGEALRNVRVIESTGGGVL